MNAVFPLALAALAIPPLAGRALGGKPPKPLPALAALAPVATVPAVAALVLAATYAWWLAVLLAIPAAVLAAWQLPHRRRPHGPGASRPPRRPDAELAGPCIKLLTLNALYGKASADIIVRRVRDDLVDVLTVQELTVGLARRLADAGLDELLPFGEMHVPPGHPGTGIWSRWPMRPVPPVPGLASPTPRVTIVVAGRSVTVTAVHLLTPLHGRVRAWQRELGQLASTLAATAGAQLVAGDFNATRDHRPFRRLLDGGFDDCADTACKRRWPGFTWPAFAWPASFLPGARPGLPLMRLDHVLATRGNFYVRASRTMRFPGTDHRGVLTIVQLRQDGDTDHGSQALP